MLKLNPSQTKQLTDIGIHLQQKRLEKTLSLEDIAAITMIRLPILQALEEGNLDQLPELVYVKGFIRRYGEILKIDGQALANTLTPVPEVEETPEPPKSVPERATKSIPVPTAKSVPTQPTQSVPVQTKVAERPVPTKNPQPIAPSSKFPLYLLLGAGAFLLGAGGLLFAGLGYFSPRPQEAQSTAPTTTPPPPPPPPPPVQASPTVTTAPNPPVQNDLEPSPPPITPLSVTVKLDDRSWVQIFVDGELGYRGTLEAGEEKTWTAKKVFNIRAGNAGAVKLSVNEKPPEALGRPGEVKERTLTVSKNP